MRRLIFLFLFPLLSFATGAQFIATKDAWLDEANATTNNNSTTVILGASSITNPTSKAHGIFFFDFSTIPAGSVINSATCSLWVESTTNIVDGVNELMIAPCAIEEAHAFNEAQCTWNIYSTGNNWIHGGASSGSGVADLANLVNATTGWISFNFNNTDYFSGNGYVKSVVSSLWTDYGVVFQINGLNDDAPVAGELATITSRSGTAAHKPRVWVDYTEPSVTVTSPNGSENWVIGSKHNITWTLTGTPTGTCKIQIDRDYASLYDNLFTGVDITLGTYEWTVDAPASPDKARIKIIGDDCATCSDESNASFTISVVSDIPITGFTASLPKSGRMGYRGTFRK